MKPGFQGKLILEFLDEAVDGKWFKTKESLSYISKAGMLYYVQRNTHTDFASVPRAFRFLISRVGRHGKSAVLHDYLCETGEISRKKADQIFLESMETLGVGWLKRSTMYLGVRAYSIITGG